jgi:hypothetical protein
MDRITFETENRKELNLLISIAEKLGIKRFIFSESSKSKQADLQKYYRIIDEGADISNFGDINEWQRTTRAERKLNFEGI